MKRALPLALTLLAACAPAPSGSEADPGPPPAALSEAAVARALGGVAWDPERPPPLVLAPEAEPALLALHTPGPGRPKVIALRATLALRHHPTEATRARLLATVAARAHPRVVAASLDTLSRAFALEEPGALRALLEPLTQDNDAEIRAEASEALARVRTARLAPA